MVDLKVLQDEITHARWARMDAESAVFTVEQLIEEIRSGRTLQEIALDEAGFMLEESPKL